jgi:hypothetical protein
VSFIGGGAELSNEIMVSFRSACRVVLAALDRSLEKRWAAGLRHGPPSVDEVRQPFRMLATPNLPLGSEFGDRGRPARRYAWRIARAALLALQDHVLVNERWRLPDA